MNHSKHVELNLAAVRDLGDDLLRLVSASGPILVVRVFNDPLSALGVISYPCDCRPVSMATVSDR